MAKVKKEPKASTVSSEQLFQMELSIWENFVEDKEKSRQLKHSLSHKEILKGLKLTPSQILNMICVTSVRQPSEEFSSYKKRMKVKTLISKHRNFLVNE